METLTTPTRELALRILDEVGFEDRITGSSLHVRAGVRTLSLYSLEDTFRLLKEPHPYIDLDQLEGWIRTVIKDEELADKVISASKEAGDKMWQMPTFEEYKEQYKSEVADFKNTGGRKAGAITAALFVGEFAEKTPWVHLDIAGTSMLDKAKGYYCKGATGVPTRTLVAFVLSLERKGGKQL